MIYSGEMRQGLVTVFKYLAGGYKKDDDKTVLSSQGIGQEVTVLNVQGDLGWR